MLWSLFFLLGAFYASHSVLADLSVKQRLYRFVPATHYRIVYNLISLAFVLAIAWTYWTSNSSPLYIPSVAIKIAGWVMLLAGVVLTGIATSNYDRYEFLGLSQLQTSSDSHAGLGGELRIRGLNAWVRHPIYASILLMVWGWFLVTPNSGVLHIAAVTTIYVPFGIYLEERKLLIEFGEAYRAYRREVKMLVPFLL